MRIKEVVTYKQLASFLQRTYNDLNKDLFDNLLPDAVVSISSTPLINGHFTNGEVWNINDNKLHEINLGAESLRRGTLSTVATLIHEMVHFYCYINKIQDTSRQGRYHNKNFKSQAEMRMLSVEHAESIGWSVTIPTEELKQYIKRKKYPDTKIYRILFLDDDGKEKVKKPSSTRKYVCPCCDNSVRATKELNILCGDCNVKMIINN